MEITIQRLSDICQAHRFHEKILFIPSYPIGTQIGELLARTGTPWINLRTTTPGGFASQLLAVELHASGKRLINPHERFFIIEKLYRSNRPQGEGSRYFGEVEEIQASSSAWAPPLTRLGWQASPHEISPRGLSAVKTRARTCPGS